MKICFVLTFSAHISAVKPNINKLKYLIPVCLHGAFPVLLIHFQGDDGTALVFAVMVVFMLWAAGVSKKYFLAMIPVILIAAPILYFFIMNDDQRDRLTAIFGVLNFGAKRDPNRAMAYLSAVARQNRTCQRRLCGSGLFKRRFHAERNRALRL